ncbi:LADA_0B01332g1_1 [Lachancea dasiensis]|uniref:LADA_0B01332g1_1 n=1 Tax=Lachancea dasiensis TaxID=1072105 RepID=A0A1G4ISE0_9SACH|nr:LADA_0B01332g1_1 [Lachancea dasiensis]
MASSPTSTAWNKLLQFHMDSSDDSDDLVIVLSAESQSSLQDFLVRVLEVKDGKSSLASIGYYHKKFDIGGEEELGRQTLVHIYTVSWPLTASAVDLLSVFINSEVDAVRWVFLLDWIQGNHKLWLRGVCDSLEALRNKLARNIGGLDFCTIVGMQAHVCGDLELASSDWDSIKMEFMNQSLRSLALLKSVSLLSFEDTTSAKDTLEMRKVVLGLKSKKTPEFIAMNKLFVPQGSDSEGKIKTMGEDFPVMQADQLSFIEKQFERIIPGRRQGERVSKDRYNMKDAKKITEIPDIDIQTELAEIYQLQKSSLLKSMTSQKSTLESLEPSSTPDTWQNDS